MRVIVCGSRTWGDPGLVGVVLSGLPRGTIVVQGGAQGADAQALAVAKQLELETETYSARWDVYGAAAGPRRNRDMLNAGADLVIAFSNGSAGTRNMIRLAQKAGVPTLVYGERTEIPKGWNRVRERA